MLRAPNSSKNVAEEVAATPKALPTSSNATRGAVGPNHYKPVVADVLLSVITGLETNVRKSLAAGEEICFVSRRSKIERENGSNYASDLNNLNAYIRQVLRAKPRIVVVLHSSV